MPNWKFSWLLRWFHNYELKGARWTSAVDSDVTFMLWCVKCMRQKNIRTIPCVCWWNRTRTHSYTMNSMLTADEEKRCKCVPIFLHTHTNDLIPMILRHWPLWIPTDLHTTVMHSNRSEIDIAQVCVLKQQTMALMFVHMQVYSNFRWTNISKFNEHNIFVPNWNFFFVLNFIVVFTLLIEKKIRSYTWNFELCLINMWKFKCLSLNR